MIAIEASNLGKTYRLYTTPAQRLKEIILRKSFHEEFVALKDINFRISTGETFGIIGENGAGKSTLLKIMAKTLKPTSGEIAINGRTAALLELGAGFNPELTGEENIYLNAYLLGLSKGEIDSKKQEIIDFSELGDSIKRPVKTYSSGMHVRLAFSIATSVDPDILIIDEALSVGDQHFQKKCVDRMMNLKTHDKTILFCSHSLYLVQELCEKAMWLQNGRIARVGEAPKVINAYNDWVRGKDAGLKPPANALSSNTANMDKPVWIDSIKLTDDEGYEIKTIRPEQGVWLKILILTSAPQESLTGHIGVCVNRNDEEPIYGITTKIEGFSPLSFYSGQEICLRFPALQLITGQYYMMAVLTDDSALHLYDIKRTLMFSTENFLGDMGIIRLQHEWKFETSGTQGNSSG